MLHPILLFLRLKLAEKSFHKVCTPTAATIAIEAMRMLHDGQVMSVQQKASNTTDDAAAASAARR
jgi:hypothetical protein